MNGDLNLPLQALEVPPHWGVKCDPMRQASVNFINVVLVPWAAQAFRRGPEVYLFPNSLRIVPSKFREERPEFIILNGARIPFASALRACLIDAWELRTTLLLDRLQEVPGFRLTTGVGTLRQP